MTRLYANRSFSRRMNTSVIVCVLAFLFGLFELRQAYVAPPGEAGYGYLFAALFVFGSIYGIRQLAQDYSDTVVSLDSDGSSARIVVWRPFRSRRIDGPLAALTGWRRDTRILRNARIDMLVADHSAHPRPLRFETGKGVIETEAFRKLSA